MLFSSVQDVQAGLFLTGYITDEITTTTVYLAAKLNKPILLEGPPGSGKTELAYAVAKATDAAVERLQCFQGINEEKAIGKFDEPLQRLAVELRSRSGLMEWEALKQELHSQKFFSAGPLLRALQQPKPCVLLIDELDKVDQAFEAQAFKRACSCFGLGRYLYYFTGTWVDLDERKRPTKTPQLVGWATPEGWRKGLRPQRSDNQMPDTGRSAKNLEESQAQQKRNISPGERDELIRQIEAMAEPLGKSLYRGLLKSLARVWNPSEIHDAALLQKVLAHMQSATRGLRRLEVALEQTGPKPLTPLLRSLDLNSLSQINTLETLHEIVAALEAKVECGARE